jgi:hypothetical protein
MANDPKAVQHGGAQQRHGQLRAHGFAKSPHIQGQCRIGPARLYGTANWRCTTAQEGNFGVHGPTSAAFADHLCGWLAGRRTECRGSSQFGNTQLHADAFALPVLVRTTWESSHCLPTARTCRNPVDVGWVKPLQDRSSTEVCSWADDGLIAPLNMLSGGDVPFESEAMRGQRTLAPCELDAYQRRDTS